MRLIATLSFILTWALVSGKISSYEGHKVFIMFPENRIHIDYLNRLQRDEKCKFDSNLNKIGDSVPISVSPQELEYFYRNTTSIGLRTKLSIENIADYMRNERIGNYSSTGMTWTGYYKLDDIYAWIDHLVNKHPEVNIEFAGSSFEKRQIKGVKISFGPEKKLVFIECGIHAREWISPATCTYIINELLTSTDPSLRRVAESFDWIIFPLTNPDGYEFTHTHDRCWRKNRAVYPDGCVGVDLNRNWDFHWGENGTSSNCSEKVYMGKKAFSEIETESLSKYIAKVAKDMVAYISFHSHSQMLMVPYGHTKEHLDNYNETMDIGKVALAALTSKHGTIYQLGNVAETIYDISGTSTDWVKYQFKTPLVYVYELRDENKYGFILPSNQIIPNGEEIVASLVAMFEEADRIGVVSMDKPA